MRPNRLTAARTAASASARLVTSSLTASRSFDCPKALGTRSLSRPVATTAWPAAKAALARCGSHLRAHHRLYVGFFVATVLGAVRYIDLVIQVRLDVHEGHVFLDVASPDSPFVADLDATEPSGAAPIRGPDVQVIT